MWGRFSTNGVPGDGSCASETSEGSPWSLQELQAFLDVPGNVQPSDYFVFTGYFVIPPNQTALSLVNIRGESDDNLEEPCPYFCCKCVWFYGGTFYYDSEAGAPTVDALVIRGSSHVYVQGFSISSYQNSDTNAIAIHHDPDQCSVNLNIGYTSVYGYFKNSLYVAPGGDNSDCGVAKLFVYQSTFYGARHAGVHVETKWGGENPYEHSDITLLFSSVSATGDELETVVGTGPCVRVASTYNLLVSGCTFSGCSARGGATDQAEDAVVLYNVDFPQIENNLFLPYQEGFNNGRVSGNNAIRFTGYITTAYVRYNLFQYIAGAALVVDVPHEPEATVQPVSGDIWFAFNILESAGAEHNRPSVWVRAQNCTANCVDSLRIVQNTFHSGVAVNSVMAFDVQNRTLNGLMIVNNIFYLADGYAGETRFVTMTGEPENAVMLGNAFVQPDGLNATLLTVGNASYVTLADLAAIGYETRNDKQTGSMHYVSIETIARLQALYGPSYTANPATGNIVDDASYPNENGDFVDGLGQCVSSTGELLDPVLRCPGQERRLYNSYEQLPNALIEAYQLREGSPLVGAGVLLEEVFDENGISSIGVFDVMFRPRTSADRPDAADPGAYRFITSLQIKAAGTLVFDGEVWVYSGNIPAGATVQVQAGGNFTWGDAPNLASNATLMVESNGIVNFFRGNCSLAAGSVLSVDSNATISAPNSRIDVLPDSTLKIIEARVSTFAELNLMGGTLIYGSGNKPMNLTRALEMGGAFVLMLPTAFRKRKQRTVVETFPVATFPKDSASGSFTSLAVMGGGACDDISIAPVQTATTLSMVVSATPKPGCAAGTTVPGTGTGTGTNGSSSSSSGLSTGAIVGICVGCAVALGLAIAVLVVVVHRRQQARITTHLHAAHRKSTMESARERYSREIPKASVAVASPANDVPMQTVNPAAVTPAVAPTVTPALAPAVVAPVVVAPAFVAPAVAAAETAPVVAAEIAPVAAAETPFVSAAEAAPVTAAEAAPVVAAEAAPVAAAEAAPVVAAEAAPVAAAEAAPAAEEAAPAPSAEGFTLRFVASATPIGETDL